MDPTRFALTFLATCVALLAAAPYAAAAAGDPDPSFGTNGTTQTLLPTQDPQVAQTEIDSQGRIVVALGVDLTSGQPGDFIVVRYLPGGALDTSFGESGFATVDIGGANDGAQALAIDSQDRILVGGFAYEELTGTSKAPLVRLDADGKLDQTFGDGGVATGIANAKFNNRVDALTVDPQGRIIAAGLADGNRSLMRFNSDGTSDDTFKHADLDTVFGNRGGTEAVIPGPGKFITLAGSSGHDTVAIQVTSKGKLNRDFGDHGVGRYLGKARSIAHDLAYDGRGRIVLAGSREPRIGPTKGDTVFSALRIKRNGKPDRSFGRRGSTYFDYCAKSDPDGDCFAIAYSVDVDTQGRIVLGGLNRGVGGRQGLAAARLTPDGKLDESFADHGKLTARFSTNDASVKSTIDPSGALIAASAEFVPSVGNSLTVARFLP